MGRKVNVIKPFSWADETSDALRARRAEAEAVRRADARKKTNEVRARAQRRAERERGDGPDFWAVLRDEAAKAERLRAALADVRAGAPTLDSLATVAELQRGMPDDPRYIARVLASTRGWAPECGRPYAENE